MSLARPSLPLQSHSRDIHDKCPQQTTNACNIDVHDTRKQHHVPHMHVSNHRKHEYHIRVSAVKTKGPSAVPVTPLCGPDLR